MDTNNLKGDKILMCLKKLLTMLCLVFLVMLAAVITANAEVMRLPSELKRIDTEAFAGTKSVDKVIVPDGVLEIRAGAFAESSVNEIVLPGSIEFIAEDAFKGSSLTFINAPCGSYAYLWASEHGYIPSGSSDKDFSYTISDNCCTIIKYVGTATNVTVPRTLQGYPVTKLGWESFADTPVVHVVLPDTVQTIDTFAFARCKSLISVSLPHELTILGEWVFSGCDILTYATVSV